MRTLELALATRNEDVSALAERLVASRQVLQSGLQALQQSERRWRAVYENSAVGIALTDTSGRFLAANPAMQRILGYAEDELQNLSLVDVMAEAEREPSRSRIAQLLDGRLREYHRPRQYLRRDGSVVWVNANVSMIPGAGDTAPMLLKVVEDVTARKQMEDALRENEARLKAVLDHSPAMIFLKDMDGRYLLANRQFEKLFRAPSKAVVVGRTDDELFPPEQAAAFRANDRRVLRADAPMEFEEVALYADGPHTSIVFKFPLRNAAGKTYALGGIATDITERKRAEAEMLALKDELAAEVAAMTRLHELSTRLLATGELQPLLEEVLDATIALRNADFGNVQLYNAATGALEIVAHRGLRQDFLDYLNSVHDGTASCGEAMQRRERVIVEDVLTDPIFAPHLQIVAAAGYRAVQSAPLFSRGGEFLGMISTHFRQPHRPSERELRLTDLYARQAAELIERKRAEDGLRTANARLELILESITDQFFGLSSDWRFTYLNKHAAEQMRVLGKDPARLIGKVLWDEFPDLPNEEALRRVMSERVAITDELYYPPLGEWVENHMYPSHDGGLVTFQRYITRRKRTEEALSAAQTEVAHVTRVMSMGELTASIAHEVNQPLAAIVANGNACLRWLARDVPDLEEARRAAQSIVRDGSRAGDIIARVRGFLRQGEPRRSRTDLDQVIGEVLGLLQGEAKTHAISLQARLADDLPPVMVDRVQVQQVLLNLALNAIEAVRPVTAGPRLVQLSADRHGADAVVVAVRDSGVGLARQHRDYIFDAFYTTKPEGLGMGLAISRSIVDAHGGRLWATPNDDSGETFQFTLPVAPAEAS